MQATRRDHSVVRPMPFADIVWTLVISSSRRSDLHVRIDTLHPTMPPERNRGSNLQGRQKLCFECAKAKRRCDLRVPSCLRCSKQHLPCSYPPQLDSGALQSGGVAKSKSGRGVSWARRSVRGCQLSHSHSHSYSYRCSLVERVILKP